MKALLLALSLAALAGSAAGQSAAAMAAHLEAMIHAHGVQGNCAACSALVESIYRAVAEGEGHHINDAGVLLPEILRIASTGFKYDPEAKQWTRLERPAETPEQHMLDYIHDEVMKTHHLTTVLSPYYLQNERHHLHEVLCVRLLQHCEKGFALDMHEEDIHEDYDLHHFNWKYNGHYSEHYDDL